MRSRKSRKSKSEKLDKKLLRVVGFLLVCILIYLIWMALGGERLIMAIEEDQNFGALPPRMRVSTHFEGRDFKPVVQILLDDARAKLSPAEATRLALYLLQTAGSAESDSAVFEWLTRDVSLRKAADERDAWEKVIADFTEFRNLRTEREK